MEKGTISLLCRELNQDTSAFLSVALFPVPNVLKKSEAKYNSVEADHLVQTLQRMPLG